MSEEKAKRPRTLFEEIELQVFTYVWMASWFVCIWWQEYRWSLFMTGTFCMVLGMIMVSSTTKPTRNKGGGESR